jgi:hypothetical protein
MLSMGSNKPKSHKQWNIDYAEDLQEERIHVELTDEDCVIEENNNDEQCRQEDRRMMEYGEKPADKRMETSHPKRQILHV